MIYGTQFSGLESQKPGASCSPIPMDIGQVTVPSPVQDTSPVQPSQLGTGPASKAKSGDARFKYSGRCRENLVPLPGQSSRSKRGSYRRGSEISYA
jgi:hypothetical protein